MTRHILILLTILPLGLFAEQAYIIDQTQVGIHQQNSVDSPIVKLVNTGDKLDILERSTKMTQVTTEDGSTGWIKNEYMTPSASSRDELEQLKKENEKLIQQLETAATPATDTLSADTQQLAAVEAELKAEQIHVGQLEAELLALKQETLNGDNAELYTHISELEQQNLELKDRLDQLLNPNAEASMLDDFKRLYHRRDEIKRYLIYCAVILIVGIIGGVAITDYLHRQRHGGFRV